MRERRLRIKDRNYLLRELKKSWILKYRERTDILIVAGPNKCMTSFLFWTFIKRMSVFFIIQAIDSQ